MNNNLNINYSESALNKKIKMAIIKDGGKNTINDILFRELGGIICTKCMNVLTAFEIERFDKNGGCCVNCENRN